MGDQGDRDLKLFDAVLATLHQEYRCIQPNTERRVVTCIHPGKHEFPNAAAELIVRFFKEHAQL